MTESGTKLTRSAGIVSAAVLTSRLLGLAREIILAHMFATGLALDAYNAAFRIPNMLRDLFGEGALSKAFVTTFTETDVKEGSDATWLLANRVLNLALVAVGILTLLGIVFAPQIVAVMLPGQGFDTPLPPDQSFGFATKRDLTIFLTRIMFPFLPLVTLAAIAMGILNSRRRFGLPALSSAFFNVGAIAVGVSGAVLCPRYGIHPAIGMAVGVLVGGLLQWLVQVPQVRSVGFRWRPEMSLRDPGVRRVGRLIGPATLGVAAVQVNVFVNTVFASAGAGWLSWINVAFRVMYLPIGIFGVAVSTTNLPALARHAAENDREGFRATLSHALRLMLVLTIPSSVGLAVLSRQIITLIYQHGAFTANDSEMAGGALLYYALGLTGYSAVKAVTDAFYALNDAMTPLRISLCAVGMNIVISAILILGFGWDHRGLALSTSITVTANFIVALAVLRVRIGGFDGRAVLRTGLKTLAASAVMGVVCWATSRSLAASPVIQVAASVAVGIVTFVACGLALRIGELGTVFRALTGRTGSPGN